MSRLARIDFGGARPTRRELTVLGVLVVLGVALRCAYVLTIRDEVFGGDEGVYDAMARLAKDGHWLWGTTPYGEPHPTFWKMPGYPVWLSAMYTVLGASATKVGLIQAVLGSVTIALTWLLGRRLTGSPRVALAAAAVIAVHPFAWIYTVLLYPESLVGIPVLLILLLTLGREPTRKRVLAVGALIGLALLLRPNMLLLLVAVAGGWWAAVGWRRGLVAGAAAAGVAVLFLVPWTIRNYDVSDGSFIPLSVQDGAIAGTFNDTSANDDENPYKWRVITERDRDIVTPPPGAPRLTEAELLKEFRKRGLRYIRDHPASVPKAFFWNGITRFWDLRSPAKIKDDALVQRGVGWVAIAGVVLHWLLLPLALVGLWRLRHNRQWFVTVVLLAALMSVATTVVSGTRYRTPLEPVVAVLACSLLAPRQNRLAS